jgi:hypothetical protein
LLGVAFLARPAPAQNNQQVQPPTLDQILERLESNLHHYDNVVPSFFCDEHVVSQSTDIRGRERSVTDSTFRLKRVPGQDHKIALTESREVKTVDGRPAKGEEVAGPGILHGAFSGALSLVSVSQQACMRYTLRPIDPDATGPYIVQFATLPGKQRSSGCLLQEDGSGRVLIDPDTMQVTRIELTAPNHTIIPAGPMRMKTVGEWYVTVDYSPVELGDQAFWMPRHILSRLTASVGMSRTIWTFDADYGNFHKLEVSSRIVPSDDAPAP